MGKIYATDNLKENNWVLNTDQISSKTNDLFIAFTNNNPIISFKDLKFGYELKQNDNIKQYGVFPQPGVRYKKTDQEYLESIRLDLIPSEKYTLYLWAENNNTRIEKEFEITTPDVNS